MISILSEVVQMQASQSLKIFLLAGVKTFPTAFNALEDALVQYMYNKNITPDIECLFPYGDAERSLMRQLYEVRADLSRRAKLAGYGGRKVWDKINEHIQLPQLLLIGHSGGGVAAYQIAKKLFEDQINITTRVVQIGSPKTRIIPQLKQSVGYIHSVDAAGQMKDPVSKLGSWGGWNTLNDSFPIPIWDAHKFAPGYIEGVPTLGGHADYFRKGEQFRDELHVCNLDKTMTSVTGYLNEWL